MRSRRELKPTATPKEYTKQIPRSMSFESTATLPERTMQGHSSRKSCKRTPMPSPPITLDFFEQLTPGRNEIGACQCWTCTSDMDMATAKCLRKGVEGPTLARMKDFVHFHTKSKYASDSQCTLCRVYGDCCRVVLP